MITLSHPSGSSRLTAFERWGGRSAGAVIHLLAIATLLLPSGFAGSSSQRNKSSESRKPNAESFIYVPLVGPASEFGRGGLALPAGGPKTLAGIEVGYAPGSRAHLEALMRLYSGSRVAFGWKENPGPMCPAASISPSLRVLGDVCVQAGAGFTIEVGEPALLPELSAAQKLALQGVQAPIALIAMPAPFEFAVREAADSVAKGATYQRVILRLQAEAPGFRVVSVSN